MIIDFSEYFYYDETSPSCLRWKVDMFCGKNHSTVKIKKGYSAGSLDNKGYYQVGLLKKRYLVHRIILSLKGFDPVGYVTDHINGNSLDNRIDNLRLCSIAENQRNKKKHKSNTSSVTGVSFVRNRLGTLCVQSMVFNLEGKYIRKHFNIDKLGLLPAFRDAVQWRQQMIAELNQQGAGYTERHGS